MLCPSLNLILAWVRSAGIDTDIEGDGIRERSLGDGFQRFGITFFTMSPFMSIQPRGLILAHVVSSTEK